MCKHTFNRVSKAQCRYTFVLCISYVILYYRRCLCCSTVFVISSLMVLPYFSEVGYIRFPQTFPCYWILGWSLYYFIFAFCFLLVLAQGMWEYYDWPHAPGSMPLPPIYLSVWEVRSARKYFVWWSRVSASAILFTGIMKLG